MRCLTNFARRRAARPPLSSVARLNRSARRKSADILRCDQFDHEACGRPFTYWIDRSGYLDGRCWRAAENIAFGTGVLGTPRRIFTGWLQSAGHRRNLLGAYDDLGVGLRRGRLDRYGDARVWTQHFAAHC